MRTTQLQPTCPPWCTETEHTDVNWPGEPGDRRHPDFVDYDQAVDGRFIHRSRETRVGTVDVSFSIITDAAGGPDTEEALVWVGNHDLTVEQARELAALLARYSDVLDGTSAR